MTEEDLAVVLKKHGIVKDATQTKNLYEDRIEPESDRIAAAALDAEVENDDEATLGNQTEAAHKEIEHLLEDAGILTRCSMCGEFGGAENAHLHQKEFIGDKCCWDERLRSTE